MKRDTNMIMKRAHVGTLTQRIFRDGSGWTSYCPELDLCSCGDTEAEAGEMLKEAIDLFFEHCEEEGDLDEALRELRKLR